MTAPQPGAAFVEPAYHQRSLGDVVPAVAAALGRSPAVVGEPPDRLTLPPAASYVVFLIDGLGAELLRTRRLGRRTVRMAVGRIISNESGGGHARHDRATQTSVEVRTAEASSGSGTRAPP